MPLSRARLLRLLHLVRDAPLAPVTWPVQSERRWRLFKVRCRRSESRHVVPERLERPVAGPAQKPAHEPGLMIVIDMESHPILWWPTAYGAHPALRRLDLLEVARAKVEEAKESRGASRLGILHPRILLHPRAFQTISFFFHFSLDTPRVVALSSDRKSVV